MFERTLHPPTWLSQSSYSQMLIYFPDLQKTYTIIPSKAYSAVSKNRTGSCRDTVKHIAFIVQTL